MYGRRGREGIGAFDTFPPADTVHRQDLPLYDYERNQNFRFVPQYLEPYHKPADLNMSNMIPVYYQRQVPGPTPTMQTRLQSRYAFLPTGVRKANMGSA